MKKTIIPIAAFAAVVFGAAVLVASARRSSSTSTTTGTDTPTTPDHDPAPRVATRDELAALLRRYMREPRTGGGRAVPVTRIHIPCDSIGRKDAWFYRLTPEQQVWFVILLYEQYDLSHGQISKLVPLSARAISRLLRDAGAVRYSARPRPSGRPLAA
jgi:hypothetical protein